VFPSPMHEDPLKLIPEEWRANAFRDLGISDSKYVHRVRGDLDPASRFIYRERMRHYSGDWSRAMQHVRVKRLLLSEKDRVGIGTFQPKDEKNQDATELTGDINYRKIAVFGSDSDPRAFNFDGEFNIANRGIIEFIEILKLDVAFLYDLLGATQERRIKPKKFAQTDIENLRNGYQHRSRVRISAGRKRHFGPETRDGARVRPRGFLQEQLLLLGDQPRVIAKSAGARLDGLTLG
jgi:serine protein kinase